MQEHITQYREERKYEIINGKVIIQSRLPNRNHNIVVENIHSAFKNYFKGKKCKSYRDDTHLRLDLIEKISNIRLPEINKKDKYRPDIMVVCDRSIDTIDGIVGAPTLIAEVLSPSTMMYDKETKKNLYAVIGVSEYWIVNPFDKSIEIYLLKNGKYVLAAVYGRILQEEPDEDIGEKPEDFEFYDEFSPFAFPDLKIKIDEVFEDMFE